MRWFIGIPIYFTMMVLSYVIIRLKFPSMDKWDDIGICIFWPAALVVCLIMGLPSLIIYIGDLIVNELKQK